LRKPGLLIRGFEQTLPITEYSMRAIEMAIQMAPARVSERATSDSEMRKCDSGGNATGIFRENCSCRGHAVKLLI
jgi:hypothetical protein